MATKALPANSKLDLTLDTLVSLTDFKLVSAIQADISYFNTIAPMVWKDQNVYAHVREDGRFINQIGTTLFGYPNPGELLAQKIWYDALKTGLTTSIIDATNIIALIPFCDPHATDLTTTLQTFISDCGALLNALSPDSEK